MCDVRLVGCKVSAEIQVSLSSKIVGVSRLLSRFFSKEMHYDAGRAAVAHILRFAIGPGTHWSSTEHLYLCRMILAYADWRICGLDL